MNQPESVEISATSVEDAIELALVQLGRTQDEVEVEVLRYPDEPDEHGFVSDEALVLVTATQAAPARGRAAPDQYRPRRTLSPGERMRVAQTSQEMLSDLLHHLGVIASCRVEPASADTDDEEAPVVLEVEGEELGVLIGRRGDNLDDLEYILNLMVQKRLGIWPNLQVDVAGYRRRREEMLQDLARRTASQVARSNQPFTFEPMPPRERRILHMAVQRDGRVVSESTGEGRDRRVVIYPASRS